MAEDIASRKGSRKRTHHDYHAMNEGESQQSQPQKSKKAPRININVARDRLYPMIQPVEYRTV